MRSNWGQMFLLSEKGTYLAEGIGEELTRLPDMPSCFGLIVTPRFSISTKQVYEKFDQITEPEHPDIDRIIYALGRKDAGVALSMGNVLSRRSFPNIGITSYKRQDENARAMGALMSGSGPTVSDCLRKKNT